MRHILWLCGLWVGAVGVGAQVDTSRIKTLQEAQVASTRATGRTPMAFAELNQEDIRRVNFGKDLPSLLDGQVSVLTSSDAGMGVGYTAMRVRGTDATRINCTVNGIPLNDAEIQGVFWVNVADLASSLGSVQLQRGVGTSTNGSGAFGASLNMQTEGLTSRAYAAFDGSAGSYGTHKETVRFATGLIDGHWAVSGRLSNLGSDGYIDRAWTRLNSYFLQAGYLADRTVVKFVTFNGTEQTYHAWDYVSRDDMARYGRRYNPCGQYLDNQGRTAYYADQTDNYHQQHYQLLWNQQLSQPLTLNVALHYTKGFGYYEQYKQDQKLGKYALPAGDGRSDLVRRKLMDNDFYGTVFSLNYSDRQRLDATVGGGWNQYDGDHYGRVIWVRQSSGGLNPNHLYYDNRSRKRDMNLYAKATYTLAPGVTAYGDVQYRYLDYRMAGPCDAYEGGQQVVYGMTTHFHFFNPKAGIEWAISPTQTLCGSVAVAHKEPTRNDYEDNIHGQQPRAERLTDLEAGYKLRLNRFEATAGLYYMLYKDQFVLTGEQNHIGEMVARNVGDSYRQGLELSARWRPLDWLQWDANATLSRNRSKNLKLPLDDTGTLYNVRRAPLSFSPGLQLNNAVRLSHKGLTASLATQYVGEQYMTTTGLRSYDDGGRQVSLMLDAYCVSNLDLSWTLPRPRGVKGATLGVTFYNLFGARYENFGAAYAPVRSTASGGCQGYQDAAGNAYAVYSAQAPLHFLAHLSLDF